MRTRFMAMAAAALVAVLAAGCSSGSGGTGTSGTLGSNGGSNNGGSNGGGSNKGSGPANIKDSSYFGLTKLTDAQLCGTMSTTEASGIIGTQTGSGQFTNTLNLGIICEWQVGGSSDKELYVGISTVIDWAGAQAVAQLLKPTAITIDGHAALGAPPQGTVLDYADLDVAVGAAHDPAVEFRAPTLDEAKALATLVLPRLLALVRG